MALETVPLHLGFSRNSKGLKMKYQKAINIWALTSLQRKALKAGQWVTAGTARGQYMGQKSPSATDVVIWHHADVKGYNSKRSALRDYALGQRGAK